MRRTRHTVEVPSNAERLQGMVVSHQDKFGFIKCQATETRYFFHVNDSDGRTSVGCTVSFIVAKDLTTGKDVAFDVQMIAPPTPRGGGLLTPRSVGSLTPRDNLTPRGGLTPLRDHSPLPTYLPFGLPLQQQQAVEVAAAAQAAAATALTRSPGPPLSPLAAAAAALSPRAPSAAPVTFSSARPAAPGPAPPSAASTAPPIPTTISFSLAIPQPLAAGRQLQYGGQQQQQQQQGRRPNPVVTSSAAANGLGAANDAPAAPRAPPPPSVPSTPLATAASGPTSEEELLPGRVRGTVVAKGRGNRRSLHGDDGLLAYVDSDGREQTAAYGNRRLEGGVQLQEGDTVDFQVAINVTTRARRALSIRLLARAGGQSPALSQRQHQHDDPTRGRQLGRVTLLKKEFGFIRQMERPGDMFFHFSQLDGIAVDEVKVGDDVEYCVKRDREGKLSAVQVRRAQPGAVVFDVVSDEVIRGVVLEKPIPSKQYLQSSGVVEYRVGGPEGPPVRLSFASSEVAGGQALKPGDHVTFRVATNLQAAKAAAQASVPAANIFAGKRAVQVAVVRPPGIVATVNRERQFGFITYSDPGTVPTPVPDKKKAGDGPNAAAADVPVAAPATGSAGSKAASEDGGAEAAMSAKGSGEAGGDAPPGLQQPPEKQRIFFHFNEVAGNVALKPDDEVLFVLHTNLKNGEINACRVKRTKEAPEPVERPLKPKKEAAPPVSTVNPNKLRLTGNLQKNTAYAKPRIAKGPDGTAGFTRRRTPPVELPPVPGFSWERRSDVEAKAADEEATARAAGEEAAATSSATPSATPAPAGQQQRQHQGGRGGRGGRSSRSKIESTALQQVQQEPLTIPTPFVSMPDVLAAAFAGAAPTAPAPKMTRVLSAGAPAFIPRSASLASIASVASLKEQAV